jgi:hypothetical protein
VKKPLDKNRFSAYFYNVMKNITTTTSKELSRDINNALKRLRKAQENYKWMKIFSIIFVFQFLALVFVFAVALDKFVLPDIPKAEEGGGEKPSPSFDYTAADICLKPVAVEYPDIIAEQPDLTIPVLFDKNEHSTLIDSPVGKILEEREKNLDNWITFLNSEVEKEVKFLEKKFDI